MNRRNYAREMDELTAGFAKEGRIPSLLLHACCAPCSSTCLELLREHFAVTVYYYNPNITVEEEYRHRLQEEMRLIEEFNRQVREQDFAGMHSTADAHLIHVLEAPYDPAEYLARVRGMEEIPEGGARCRVCFEMRLRRTAEAARDNGFDYITTTLTISPLKNAAVLNEVCERAAAEYGVGYLPSDFKKKEGYKRSVELSEQFGLYRQNYCGCVFSGNRSR